MVKNVILVTLRCLVVNVGHIPDEKWKKLDPKSHKCIFIGYSEDSKAYRLFDTST